VGPAAGRKRLHPGPLVPTAGRRHTWEPNIGSDGLNPGNQWEYLAGEQSLLDLEREHRQDEERALARQQDLLDKERELLAERRELLQAGWQNLEEARKRCLVGFPEQIALS
jgi:hypothetical protein